MFYLCKNRRKGKPCGQKTACRGEVCDACLKRKEANATCYARRSRSALVPSDSHFAHPPLGMPGYRVDRGVLTARVWTVGDRKGSLLTTESPVAAGTERELELIARKIVDASGRCTFVPTSCREPRRVAVRVPTPGE